MNRATDRDFAHELDYLKNQVFSLQRRIQEQVQFAMPPKGRIKALDFAVDGIHLCLPLEQTQIVVARPQLSVLPEAPPWIAGMLNFHGHNLPVIDILHRFRERSTAPALSDLVIVAAMGDHRVGLLVQEVFDLLVIHGDQLEQVDQSLPYANYVAGIVALETCSSYLLSLDRLLLLTDTATLAEPG